MVYELFLNESYVTGSQGMHILGLYRFCHQYGFLKIFIWLSWVLVAESLLSCEDSRSDTQAWFPCGMWSLSSLTRV